VSLGPEPEIVDFLEPRLDDADRAAVETRQYQTDESPAEELLAHAKRANADQIVAGLRRYSRTERIIFGSVACALRKRTDIPIALVPLEAEETEPEPSKESMKYMC